MLPDFSRLSGDQQLFFLLCMSHAHFMNLLCMINNMASEPLNPFKWNYGIMLSVNTSMYYVSLWHVLLMLLNVLVTSSESRSVTNNTASDTLNSFNTVIWNYVFKRSSSYMSFGSISLRLSTFCPPSDLLATFYEWPCPSFSTVYSLSQVVVRMTTYNVFDRITMFWQSMLRLSSIYPKILPHIVLTKACDWWVILQFSHKQLSNLYFKYSGCHYHAMSYLAVFITYTIRSNALWQSTYALTCCKSKSCYYYMLLHVIWSVVEHAHMNIKWFSCNSNDNVDHALMPL